MFVPIFLSLSLSLASFQSKLNLYFPDEECPRTPLVVLPPSAVAFLQLRRTSILTSILRVIQTVSQQVRRLVSVRISLSVNFPIANVFTPPSRASVA